MQIRRAYLRRSVKRARLQKRLLAAAMLAATGCAACLLQPVLPFLPQTTAKAAPAVLRAADGPPPAAPRWMDLYSIVADGGALRGAGFSLDGQHAEGERLPLQSFPDGAGLLAPAQEQAAFRNDSLERMALPGLPWHDRQAGLTLLKAPGSNADSGMADGTPAGAAEPASGASGATSTGSSDNTAADGAGNSGAEGTAVLALLALFAVLRASAAPAASLPTPRPRRLP